MRSLGGRVSPKTVPANPYSSLVNFRCVIIASVTAPAATPATTAAMIADGPNTQTTPPATATPTNPPGPTNDASSDSATSADAAITSASPAPKVKSATRNPSRSFAISSIVWSAPASSYDLLTDMEDARMSSQYCWTKGLCLP